MSRKIREFKCECNKSFDKLVYDDTHTYKCECGQDANRVLTAARYFDNTTGKSPSAKS